MTTPRPSSDSGRRRAPKVVVVLSSAKDTHIYVYAVYTVYAISWVSSSIADTRLAAETALRGSAKNSIRIHYLYILAPHLHFESLDTTPARLHYPRAISLLNSVSGQEIARRPLLERLVCMGCPPDKIF